jgi:hypothetical protein
VGIFLSAAGDVSNYGIQWVISSFFAHFGYPYSRVCQFLPFSAGEKGVATIAVYNDLLSFITPPFYGYCCKLFFYGMYSIELMVWRLIT